LSGLLLDTNVVSELRKAHRANASVLAWYAGVSEQSLWLSVLVLGEIRRGIETLRRRDRKAALALDRWATIAATNTAKATLAVGFTARARDRFR